MEEKCFHKFRIDRLFTPLDSIPQALNVTVRQNVSGEVARRYKGSFNDPHIVCEKCNENWVCINTRQYTQDDASLPISVGDALREGRDIEAIVIWMEFNWDKIDRILEWMGFDMVEIDSSVKKTKEEIEPLMAETTYDNPEWGDGENLVIEDNE